MALRAERVAVTGVGVVSALGASAERTFERLCAGESGIAALGAFDGTDRRSTLAAEVGSFDQSFVPRAEADRWSRSDRMAVAAALDALRAAGIADASRLSLAVGGTTGGMREAEEVLAAEPGCLPARAVERLLAYPLSTSLDRLTATLGARAHAATLCSACSSGANALLLAACWIASGRASQVLAGGTDALCRLTFSGFDALGVLSPEPCRPFDLSRKGLTLGEGAAFLMLESEASARARGVRVLAWLDGWSVGAEAHHITHPEPSGETAARLLGRALQRAGLAPVDVDYVNAHGTATVQNDAAEARALAIALGAELTRIRVSSSKGQLGHTLGAAGALEAAVTVLAVDRGLAPPTGGLVTPDPELGLSHVVGTAEPLAIRAALSSSFGFGGTGTVLAFTHSGRERSEVERAARAPRVRSVATLFEGSLATDAAVASAASPGARGSWLDHLEASRSRRFDSASAMVTFGASAVLRRCEGALSDVGLVAGSAYGNVERSVAFLRRVLQRGPRFASPADFPHLVPSAAAGNAGIYLGLRGPVLALADASTSAESALAVALALLDDGQAESIVAGSAEPRDEVVERLLAPLKRTGPAAGGARGEGASFVLVTRERSAGDVAVTFWSDAARSEELPAPTAPRALVGSPLDDASSELLEASAWRRVERRAPSVARVPPEAAGGFGVAQAIAWILSGEADETLWVSRRYAFVFSRGA